MDGGYIDADDEKENIAISPRMYENQNKKLADVLSTVTSATINIHALWNLMRPQDEADWYLFEEKRKQHEIVWHKQTAQWRYKVNKRPVADGTHMFVATTINKSNWQFWIVTNLRFHSQLIGINPNDPAKINERNVRAAGHIYFVNALMLILTNGSGHYKPQFYQMFYLLWEVYKMQYDSKHPVTFQACHKNKEGEVEAHNVTLHDDFFLLENNQLATPGDFADKVFEASNRTSPLAKENQIGSGGLRFSSEDIKKEIDSPSNHCALFQTKVLQPITNINTADQRPLSN